jgi:salicylate hydroxylase
LSANAMHVLNHLGLGDAIAKPSVRPGAYVFRLHHTGEIIGQFPLPKTSVSDLPKSINS